MCVINVSWLLVPKHVMSMEKEKRGVAGQTQITGLMLFINHEIWECANSPPRPVLAEYWVGRWPGANGIY